MSTLPTATTTPAIDRLCTACWIGDLPAADAAIADGAIVNDEGRAPGWDSILPLYAALVQQHRDIVLWLLCGHGADPNGDEVMWAAACYAAARPQLQQHVGAAARQVRHVARSCQRLGNLSRRLDGNSQATQHQHSSSSVQRPSESAVSDFDVAPISRCPC